MSFKRLDEVAKNASRTFEFKGEPVVFINTGDVLEGSFLHKDLSNPTDLPGQAKKRIEKNDILYSEIRPGNKRYAFVNFDAEEYVVSTKFMVIEVNDIVLPKYLYIFLTSSKVESELKMIADSRSGTFPQVTFDSIGYLQVYVPNQKEQKEIINFWESLDHKIHLNQQTNETLEAMAQAIFKSWFVDFDPVRAKIEAKSGGRDPNRAAMAAIAGISLEQDWDEIEAALDQKLARMSEAKQQQLTRTAKLFPNELVESEIGEVPMGWGISKLEDYLTLSYGKGLRKKDREEGKIPVYGSGGLTGTHDESLIDGPGIIVGRKGTVGSIYWEDRDFWPIDTVFYVEPKKEVDLSFYYYLLKTLRLDEMNTDAAVPGLNRNNAYRLQIPEFPEKLMKQFADFTSDLHAMMHVQKVEKKTLEKLRDMLLPKLISGEKVSTQYSC